MPLTLAKPRAVANAFVLTSSDNYVGSGSGNRFVFKLKSAQLRISTRVQSTTGDGDIGTKYEHNGMSQMQGVLHGMYPARAVSLLKIANLARVNSGSAPVPGIFTLQVGSGRTLTQTVWIHRIDIDWDKEGVDIPVTMHIISTSVALAEA